MREEYNSQGLFRVIDMSPFKDGGIKNNTDTQKIASVKKPFKAYNGSKPYIFISYAHKDSEPVFNEIKKFHDEGYPIWYDQGLTAGREWDEEIKEALLNSSLPVVFITRTSISRSNVVDEIKLALEEQIDIVPIYLEEAETGKGFKIASQSKTCHFQIFL